MSLKHAVLIALIAVLPACSTPGTIADSEHPETTAIATIEHDTKEHATNEHDALYAEIIQTARITILGELHGNSNSPKATLEMANDIFDAHGAVTVGLEIPVSDQAALDKYLNSEGSTADRQALISSTFWSETWADGRSSLALVELLETLRQQKQAGHDIDLLAIDGRTGTRGEESLELEMAEPIIEWARIHPERKMVLLVGNVHARLAPIQFGEQTIEPMAMFVVANVSDVVSINLAYDGGATLARTEAGLGTINLAAPTPGRRGLQRLEETNASYHFEWALEPAIPSAPAFSEAPGIPPADR